MFRTFGVAVLMNSKVTALKCFSFTPRKIFGSLLLPTGMAVYQAHSKPETKIYKGAKEVYYSRIINI